MFTKIVFQNFYVAFFSPCLYLFGWKWLIFNLWKFWDWWNYFLLYRFITMVCSLTNKLICFTESRYIVCLWCLTKQLKADFKSDPKNHEITFCLYHRRRTDIIFVFNTDNELTLLTGTCQSFRDLFWFLSFISNRFRLLEIVSLTKIKSCNLFTIQIVSSN